MDGLTEGGVFDDTIGVMHIFAGQSNADSYGTDGESFPGGWVADEGIQIWVPASNKFETYNPGVNSDYSGGAKWGPEAEFARRWRLANPNVPFYIVKVSAGATALAANGATDWSPSSSGELFDALFNNVNLARHALATKGLRPKVENFIWVHGEADGSDDTMTAAYQSNLESFIATWRASLSEPNMRFVLSRLNTEDFGFPVRRADLRAAQVAVGIQHLCGWVDTDSLTTLPLAPPFAGHYDPDSVKELGRLLFVADQAITP